MLLFVTLTIPENFGKKTEKSQILSEEFFSFYRLIGKRVKMITELRKGRGKNTYRRFEKYPIEII